MSGACWECHRPYDDDPTPRPATSDYAEARKTATGLLDLPADWYGPESLAIGWAAVNLARQLLHVFEAVGAPCPGVFPTVAGGVMLEWFEPLNAVVELDGDGTICSWATGSTDA